ncbi:MAG: hypothetical protein PVJ31_00770 [Methyloceanibacter sp.]|jgi:NADH:ubiquinone oxidoreductase subunit 6 (subunit J)
MLRRYGKSDDRIILVVLLALLVVCALFVWWRYDMHLADIAAASVTPAIGIWLIYDYGGPLAWAGGLLLLAIGGFAIFCAMKRHDRRATRRGNYRDEQ